ncbi:phosphatase PAP2 family protein [Virgibacillus oceani]
MKRNYWIIFILLFVVLFMMGVWVVHILQGRMPYVDLWTREPVELFSDTFIYTFFRYITELGSEWFLVPFTITVGIIIWIVFKNWLPALIFSGGTLLSHLLNILIKHLVERERPSIYEAANAEGHSFPSGHAMVSMVCYGLLAYFIAKKITSARVKLAVHIFFALLILLIGISRYIINVHFLTDVVAGFVTGFLLLVGLIYLYEALHRWQSQPRD